MHLDKNAMASAARWAPLVCLENILCIKTQMNLILRTSAGPSKTRLQKCLIFFVISCGEWQTASELIYGVNWPLLYQIIRQERCSLLVVLLRVSGKWLSDSICESQRLNCGFYFFFSIQTGQIYCIAETIPLLFIILRSFCNRLSFASNF